MEQMIPNLSPEGISVKPHYHPTNNVAGGRKRGLSHAQSSHVEISTDNLELVATRTNTKDCINISVRSDDESIERGPRHPHREYLHGRRLLFASCGWLMTEFMGGMGGNMLGPALPIVASQFNGLNQLGWVGGAFYMTQCAMMLLFGQLLALFNAKYVLISAVAMFMLGSTISGAANSIEALIIGRAFAGIGAAGCWVCVQTTVAMLVVLDDRPRILGLFGLQNAISGTCGPIIAGAFANAGHWRWCFFIVLPLGALTIALQWFTIPSLPPFPLEDESEERLRKQIQCLGLGKSYPHNHWVKRVLLVDLIGYFLCTSSLICFILALQYGGTTFPWKSTQVIGLFVGFPLIFGTFVLWEHKAAWPILPIDCLGNRTNVGASLLAMFTLMCNLFWAIFGPILYEAGCGINPLHAGLMVIPFLLTVIVSQAIEGSIMSYTKTYWHWGLGSPLFLAVAGGLLFTVKRTTSSTAIIGYQILYGIGVGWTQSVAFISVQADNPTKAVPAAIALVSFVQLFGGMCGPVIGQTILKVSLQSYLPEYGIPIATQTEVEQSVRAIAALTGDVKLKVIDAYLRSLNNVYIAVVPTAFLIILSAFLTRNRSLKVEAH